MKIREFVLLFSLLIVLDGEATTPGLSYNTRAESFQPKSFENLTEKDRFLAVSGSVANSDFTYIDTCQYTATLFSNFFAGPDSIHWDFDDPVSGSFNFSTSSIIQHFFINPGIYSVQCIVFANNTSDTTIKQITIVPVPVVNLGSDTSICTGTTLQLLAGSTPGATYLWQDGSTASTFSATTSQNYNVTVTEYGCSTTDSIKIIFTDLLLFPTTDTTVCNGTNVFLDAGSNGPLSLVQWNDGYPLAYRFIDTDGVYIATVTLGNCSKTSSYTLHTLSKPIVYLGEDTILCIGGTWLLNASYPSSTYLWQDGSTGPTLNAIATESYGVQVSNQCGIAADSIYIEFVECKCNIFFPKAFTPNKDNHNEIYNFKYDCLEFQSQLRIFNRWGTLVFESNDAASGWDGTFKNNDADTDSYIYVLKYSGVIDGKIQEEEKRGTFLLFR